MTGTEEGSGAGRGRLYWAMIPVFVFAALAVALLVGLYSGDPTTIPSALVGRPVPAFELGPLDGLNRAGEPVPGLAAGDLANGAPAVVNIWASWCGPCRQEHPVLMGLASAGLRVVAINYKDDAENARRFLGSLGNPFSAVGVDDTGRSAIDWGVYGVPETFVVGGDGVILAKHVGPLSPEAVEAVIVPALERAGQ